MFFSPPSSQVGVFSPSIRSHYLNITPNNVVRFYTKIAESGELCTETLSKFMAADFKPPEPEPRPASPAASGELSIVMTFRVSGQVIETDRSVCVCASVCQLALSRLNRLTYGHDIWYRD